MSNLIHLFLKDADTIYTGGVHDSVQICADGKILETFVFSGDFENPVSRELRDGLFAELALHWRECPAIDSDFGTMWKRSGEHVDNCAVCGEAAVTERDNRPVCSEHRSMIDSGVFKLADLLTDDSTENRGDKAIIEDLRRQLQAVTAERDRYRTALETISNMTSDWSPGHIARHAMKGGE